MKKLVLTFALLLTAVMASFAQPRAIGIGGTFASPIEISYQHNITDKIFLEGNLGFMFPFFLHYDANYDYIGYNPERFPKRYEFGVMFTATANYVLFKPSWTSYGSWEIYAGSGLSLGYVPDAGSKYLDPIPEQYYYHRLGMGFMMSVPLNAGLSFTFPFRLRLSAIMRPQIGFQMSQCALGGGEYRTGFYDYGLFGFIPHIGVHYAF
ncbi:MAG: hypothetical protein J5764_06345 [Bacteroidales bacterium]|nr:hypothetical protein [Bacteroidales bacterium]